MGILSKEAKAEVETHPLITDTKIGECLFHFHLYFLI